MHFHFLSGPRRAKKVLFLFLQKLFWHFYTIQIVFLYVFLGIQRTESWCCSSKPMIVYHHQRKKAFLELILLPYYLLLLLSPFFYIQKIQQTTQKNFAFLLFRVVVGVTFVWLSKAFTIFVFFVSAEVFWRYFLPL